MKIARIPLLPNSRFHFGEFKVDNNVGLSSTSSFAHSDTLFSALITSYDSIGDANILINAFKEGSILISSLFYYVKTRTQILYFLPKPVFLEVDSKSDGNHKLRNKIKFVSSGVWEQGFNQKEWTEESKYVIIQKEFLVLRSEYDNLTQETGLKDIKIFNITQNPKSPIRKNDPKDSIFYLTNIEIVDNKTNSIETGFFFIYVADVQTDIMIKDATNILSKSGIGGEKNNMGRVMGDPYFEDFDIRIDSETYSNISIVCPFDFDDFQKVKLYKTFVRGGRDTQNNGNYQTIRMICEGALVDKDLKGRLVIIGKDDQQNEALRNGLALTIPVKPS